MAQAQTVVVNNTSSTNSTSTATTPGQSASTTTSGVGSTGVQVAGGVDTLDVDSTGSSNSAAAAGPHGASATSNSTNESDVSLDCHGFGCGSNVVCPGTICKTTVIPHHPHPVKHHVAVPVPVFTFVPIPVQNVTAGRDIHSCESIGSVDGLINLDASCLSLLNDLNVNLEDLIDLPVDIGDISLLDGLLGNGGLTDVLNGLLGTGLLG
ncbi:MAG TPA: hypothetical protein VHL54_05640 [Actinomycetota bacterium]|nr:hypothetical protein [Actinomycetota bacterium]